MTNSRWWIAWFARLGMLLGVCMLLSPDAWAKCRRSYYKHCKSNSACKRGYVCQKRRGCIPSRCWCDARTGKRLCTKDCRRGGVCVRRDHVAWKKVRRGPLSRRTLSRAFRSKMKKKPKKYKERRSSGWVTTTYGARRRRRYRRGYRRGYGGYARRSRRSRPSRSMPMPTPRKSAPMAPPPARSSAPRVSDSLAGPSRVAVGGGMAYRPAPARRAPVRRRYRRKRRTSRHLIAQSSLKAGETDDNKKFDAYLMYHRRHANLLPAHYRMDITERYTFRVTDKDGRQLPNCRVVVTGKDKIIFRGRTDSRGQLLFFPRTMDNARGVKQFYVSFLYKGKTQVRKFKRARHGTDKPWRVSMPVRKRQRRVNLDLLFLLDTTGSMSDEIARIQATLLAITAKIRKMKQRPKIRFGMVLYRDRTDQYTTRRFPFTTNVHAFNKALRQVRAGGGGDYAEAMNMGLYTAVEQMKWSKNALRLMFLVADAPPHLDYNDDVPYTKTLQSAVAKGIKIFPTAASGLGARGSYIYRQIAQYTQARFLFIKYGRNTAASHGISGPTKSNNLDDIIVRIVSTEINQYSK